MYRICIFLIAIIPILSFGKGEYKYGKVSIDELSQKKYPKDSLTGAVILYNVGETETSSVTNYSTLFTRKEKIKIYDKKAFDLADQTFILYNDKNSTYGITVDKLKGKTYNMEDGKIVETDLPKSAVKIDKLDDYHDIVHIAFTNVKEGSIIEYEIRLNLPGQTIPDWYFQQSYPVEYSEFTVNMIEFLKYRQSTKGYLTIPAPEESSRNEGASMYSVNTSIWKMSDVPAFVEEPYMYCPDNYIAQINHELLSVHIPHEEEVNFTTNWNEVIKKLLGDSEHGQLLNSSSEFLNKEYNTVKDIKDNVDRMKGCYAAIQKSMNWNHVTSIFSFNMKNAHKETKGNSADINFMLLRLLKDCNIESYPVILSTRENGFVPLFPSFDKFNYVIVLAKINGQSYLLDGTEKYLSPNILPTRCLNGQGLIVKAGTTAQWVDLTPKQSTTILNSTEIKLNEDGSIKGKVTYKRTGYAALDVRNNITENTTEVKQDWIMKKAKNGIEISNYSITNKDSMEQPVVEKFDFHADNSSTESSNTIIFDPILFEKMEDNPFKNPDRIYPVEFSTPIDKTYIINIALPDNMTIEDKPKSIAYNMPDNSAKFTYQLNVVGNAIQLNAKLNIKNTIYSQDQYPYLKEFYAQVISKLNEPILLQKKQ